MVNLFYLITCVISRKINILSLKMLKLLHVNMFKVIIFVRTYTTMILRSAKTLTELTMMSISLARHPSNQPRIYGKVIKPHWSLNQFFKNNFLWSLHVDLIHRILTECVCLPHVIYWNTFFISLTLPRSLPRHPPPPSSPPPQWGFPT